MVDRIFIKDLLVRAIVGINEDERINKQDVMINVVLEADTQAAARSDHIDHAVNYRTVAKAVIALVENSEFLLVEKMADEIAKLCLQDRRVLRTHVTVEKPTALRFAASVGLTITRSRENYPDVEFN